MPQKNNPQKASDRVPEDYGAKIISEIENYSKHEDFRKKVREIFEDCTDSVGFMDKVKRYASREIDERIFKNVGTIFIWIGSVVVASIIGAFISPPFFCLAFSS